MEKVTVRALLKAGAHLGHRTRFWNPKMGSYIFGSYRDLHIINLEQTVPALKKACDYVKGLAYNREKLMFVGTKAAASDLVREVATKIDQPYVAHRWLGGMLTNYKTIRSAIKRLHQLEGQQEDGTFERLTKKEALMLKGELDKLNRSLGGIKKMPGLPDALFVIDVKKEHIAVSEACKLGIPIIAIVDTNSDPDAIDYPIPGNDDATRALKIFIEAIAAAYSEGIANAERDNPQVEEKKLKVKITDKPARRAKRSRANPNSSNSKGSGKKAKNADEQRKVAESPKATKSQAENEEKKQQAYPANSKAANVLSVAEEKASATNVKAAAKNTAPEPKVVNDSAAKDKNATEQKENKNA